MKLKNSMRFYLYLFFLLNSVILAKEFYSTSEIELSGNPFFSKEQLFFGETKEYAANQLLDYLFDFYLNRGFPFVKIKILPAANKLVLNINSGNFVKIDQALFPDSLVTSKKNLLLISRYQENSVFKQAKIEQALNYFYQSELFEFPVEIKIYKPEKYSLFFDLKEKKYYQIDGILSYSKKSGTNNSTFSGFLNLSSDNLWGSLRKFDLLWEKKEGNYETINLFYQEPYLLSYPLHFSVDFNQDNFEEKYLSRKFKMTLIYEYDLNFSLDLFTDYENIFPKDELEPDSKIRTYGSGLKYSFLDFRIPYSFETKVELMNMKIEEEFSENRGKLRFFYKHQFKYNKIFSIKQDNYFAIVEKTDRDLKEYEGFKVGGVASLRGYFEKQFLTSEFFLSRNNLNYNLGDNSVFLFYDLGIIKENNADSFLVRNGLGIGIRLVHGLGINEIILAYPLEEGFELAKIHVKFIANF